MNKGWSASIVQQREFGLDVIRVYLGVALLVRGALFVADRAMLAEWMERSGWFWPVMLGHVIAMAHIAGGLCLAAGLFTRIAAAVQIPPLFGAVFLVHWQEGLMQPGQSLELAGLVLVLLIVFAVYGGGPHSLDRVLGLRNV